jgi:hypothetical protein
VKELAPYLALGFGLALAVVLLFVVRMRLGRLAEALGAEVSWCRLSGRRGGHDFSYCQGSQHSRPRLSLLEMPVGHELAVLSRACAGRLGARAGLERELAGIEPGFDAAVAVFSEDEEFARALFARPEARRATMALLEGTRDRLLLQRHRLSLVIGRGACGWRLVGVRGTCGERTKRLSAGLDRLVELAPLVSEAAKRAPEPRESWRRSARRFMPAAGAIGAALAIAVALLVKALVERGG